MNNKIRDRVIRMVSFFFFRDPDILSYGKYLEFIRRKTMFELIAIMLGVAVGTLLAIVITIVLSIKYPRFVKDCLIRLAIIGKEFIEFVIDTL